MTECIIKSIESREGATFRILKDDKYIFANVKFANYFYVKTEDFRMIEQELLKLFSFAIKSTQDLGQFTKIFLSNNFMRPKIREFIEQHCRTFEADIRANKRFLLDGKLEMHNELVPYTFYDIETDDRTPMQKDGSGRVVPGNNRILSFSAVDHNNQVTYYDLAEETPEAEITLLKQILDYFSNYGIVSGWNSEKFDMPYIKGRCDSLEVNYDILEFVNHMDYMELFKKYDKKSRKSYSLNNISNEELKESKIEQAKGRGAIYNTWKTDREHLKKYNIQDSQLIHNINKKLMFIEVAMHRANLAKCHVRNTMNNSDCGDYLLMRKFKERNIIMPSQPTRAEVEKRKEAGAIGGGYTNCFLPGFHKQVRVWDFKSMYPSVISTWNISPETLVETLPRGSDLSKYKEYIVTPSDTNSDAGVTRYHPHRIYRKDIKGVIPEVVDFLVAERDKIKYVMAEFKKSDPDKYRQMYLEQYALKTEGNAIYGVMAFPSSRYYSWEMGDTVTTCCRAMIKGCYQKLVDWFCKVIGGDTDSTFAILGSQTIEEIDAKFIEYFNEWVKQWNIDTHKLVFEYEKTFDTMLFVKKKNYAYKIGEDITIKGLEAIKADANAAAASLQKDFILQALNENLDLTGWETVIDTMHDRCFNQELNVKELTLVKSLTKMPDDYAGYTIDKKTGKPKIKADGTLQQKSIPAHVLLAERMLEKGVDVFPGQKLQFIVIHDKPIIAITPVEFELKSGSFKMKHKKRGIIDYTFDGTYAADYYWLRIIKPLLKVVYCYYGKLPEWSWNLTPSQLQKVLGTEDSEE